MKPLVPLAAFVFLLVGCAPMNYRRIDVAAHPDALAALKSSDPALAANKRLVFDMWRTIVNAGHIEAADTMMAEGYIQHSPVLRTGRKAFKEIFSVVPRREIPALVDPPLVQSVAEGNLVVMSLAEPVAAHEGSQRYVATHFNLFRIENGRLAEHWHSVHAAPDAKVPLPEDGGPQLVVGSVGEAQARWLASPDAHLARNKRLVFDLWREVVDAGQVSRAGHYFRGDFIEHAFHATPGGGDTQTHPSHQKAAPVRPWIAAPVVAIVAEGDYVALVTMKENPHPIHPGRIYTTTWFHMFRIADGRVAEHWDDSTPAEPATVVLR